MVYCTYTNVNSITNLTSSDIANEDITTLISTYATPTLNSDINTLVVREQIDWIDDTRKNKVDGSNTTYYIKEWKEKFIADFDDDGDVDISDITVYQVASDGTETTLTISTITPNEGKFVLSSAPNSGVRIYITYKWAYISESDPHPLVISACAHLAAALAFEKINTGRSPTVVFGNARFTRHMVASNLFYKKYQMIVNQINNRQIDFDESEAIV